MTPAAALKLASNPDHPAAERVKAFENTDPTAFDAAALDAVAAVATDTDAAKSVRRAALDQLLLAQFSSPDFPKWRKPFIRTLLKLSDDKVPDLVEVALGQLVKLRVAAAQEKLLGFLREPQSAPLSQAKALQLLRYDPHTNAYPVARDLAANGPDLVTRQAAIRLLAADPGATDLLTSQLADQGEHAEIRRVSAAALNAVNPQAYQAYARRSVLDAAEHQDVKAQSLTALALQPDQPEADRAALAAAVQDLAAAGDPSPVRAAARQYARRHLDGTDV